MIKQATNAPVSNGELAALYGFAKAYWDLIKQDKL